MNKAKIIPKCTDEIKTLLIKDLYPQTQQTIVGNMGKNYKKSGEKFPTFVYFR